MRTLLTTAVAAAAIGLGALVGAPVAQASEKSDCAAKGGTYTETTVYDQTTGKTGVRSSCCVKDAATNTTTCTSATVTAQSIGPTRPIRVPVGILTAGPLEPAAVG